MNYVEPWFMIIQTVLVVFYVFVAFQTSAESARGKSYSWKTMILFVVGIVPFYFFAVIYQTLNLTVAWMHTLKISNIHAQSTLKRIANCKHL